MEQKRFERFATPHQYDHAPQGTELIVKLATGWKLYKQMSPDEENPKWECIDENFIPHDD